MTGGQRPRFHPQTSDSFFFKINLNLIQFDCQRLWFRGLGFRV